MYKNYVKRYKLQRIWLRGNTGYTEIVLIAKKEYSLGTSCLHLKNSGSKQQSGCKEAYYLCVFDIFHIQKQTLKKKICQISCQFFKVNQRALF